MKHDRMCRFWHASLALALAATLAPPAQSTPMDAVERFKERVEGGHHQYLGYPLDHPTGLATIHYGPGGSPDGMPVSDIVAGSTFWRWAVKGAATVLGGAAAAAGVAATAALTTGGVATVPAAVWGYSAGSGAAATAAAALLGNLPDPTTQPQDVTPHKRIELRQRDVTPDFIQKLLEGGLQPLLLPGGALFIPSDGIDISLRDKDGNIVPGGNAAFGLLQVGDLLLPTMLADYDYSQGTRGILQTDYLYSDVEWLRAKYPDITPGDHVYGDHLFLQVFAVPEPATHVLVLTGLGLAVLMARRRRQPPIQGCPLA